MPVDLNIDALTSCQQRREIQRAAIVFVSGRKILHDDKDRILAMTVVAFSASG